MEKKGKAILPSEKQTWNDYYPGISLLHNSGKGNPNDDHFPEYIGVLYSLSYAVKMSPKKGFAPDDYFDFTVYSLEGIWDISKEAKEKFDEQLNKDDLIFNLMIRQPEFVTNQFTLEIIEHVKKTNPHQLLEKLKFKKNEDGLSLQMMHLGSYDNEPESFRLMEEFTGKENLKRRSKVHREIYLSDARKVEAEKLKTVLRVGVERL